MTDRQKLKKIRFLLLAHCGTKQELIDEIDAVIRTKNKKGEVQNKGTMGIDTKG